MSCPCVFINVKRIEQGALFSFSGQGRPWVSETCGKIMTYKDLKDNVEFSATGPSASELNSNRVSHCTVCVMSCVQLAPLAQVI